MISKNNIPCPNCRSNTCVLGKLDPSNSDLTFEGEFYPAYIKPKSFWSIIDTRVNLESEKGFYACYSCGHLWSKINKDKLKSVLENLECNGDIQIIPKQKPPIFDWFIYGVLISLVLLIFFLKLNT